MSHLRERKEKDCLNCNAEISGRFCAICGQENIEPGENLWHLVSHFFKDITHFDGKFFSSMQYLLVKPGFLSAEYLQGRRASYLNPVRMYVFTSAFFFLIFFNFFASTENLSPIKFGINGKSPEQVAKMDSSAFADYTRKINRQDHKPDIPMSRQEFAEYAPRQMQTGGFFTTDRKFKTRAGYDSAIATDTIKDGWLERQVVYRLIDLNIKYKYNSLAIRDAFIQGLLHSIPQMMFLSLPFLALLLKLLYWRRKNFFYVNHAIFSIHLYIFIFITLLAFLGLGRLNDHLNWGFLNFFNTALFFFIFYYTYKAMRNFYQQGRAKTIAKFLILLLLFSFVLLMLFAFFIFFSFFKI